MRIKQKCAGALNRVIKESFGFWQRIGIHVTPNNFYEPIPDTTSLKDKLWSEHSQLVGINMNDQRQLELLSMFNIEFKDEYQRFPRERTRVRCEYFINNGVFESVDGEILYCMVRKFKPKLILEIGSGFSTFLSANAVIRNKECKSECELVSIEPYPNEILQAGFQGLTKLIPQKVQEVPFSTFEELQENDILFIDSSHVLKIGSDVQYEYLEILPRLNKGVIIHVHDIFLPKEYPRKWVLKNHIFWNEQYLLQAFLSFNESFEVLWAGNYIHSKYPDKLEFAFGSYDRNRSRPGSFWLRKIK
ncbi:MAG TPA: class I SAM-dependent methyltransferase [Anaerovoracaceae bacterium]|nr:class I SAM-dependent methyltransferase [Anaerovoracaceae bacterium]